MKTRKFCPKCGRPVVRSTTSGYVFQCFGCDEDFYRFEVIKLKDIELARTIWEIEYLDGLARGEFMPASFKKAYPRPKPTKNQKANNHGRNSKKHNRIRRR